MTTQFPPTGIPQPGDVVLVTDELASPADFLLHRVLGAHLKLKPLGRGTDTRSRPRAVVLSVEGEGDVERWKSVAAKSNLNLAQHITTGSLSFIDVLSYVPDLPYVGDGAVGVLRPVVDALRAVLSVDSTEEGVLVILDDISALEWLGIPILELTRFVRALVALCRTTTTTLLIRHHITTPNEPDELLRHLLQVCSYRFDVFPLSTGRSGSVSGQIAFHPGSGLLLKRGKPISRDGALQYRLTDAGCVFFERGTSSGVL